jgi:hypothetical protein
MEFNDLIREIFSFNCAFLHIHGQVVHPFDGCIERKTENCTVFVL